jgi:hypothetical protein
MADADLDVIIRQLAKQQTKTLTAAAKTRRDHFLGLAGKAKDASAKARFKLIAQHASEQGAVAAKRLQISADNAADSYARAMRKALDAPPAKLDAPPAKKAEKKPAKKATKTATKTAKS